MQQVTKHKLVRRGQKYCVRVQGVIDPGEVQMWCYERNIKGRGKVNSFLPNPMSWNSYVRHWDYDFIFDTPTDATAFILGYL